MLELTVIGPGDFSPYGASARVPGVRIDNRWVPEREIGAIFEESDVLVVPYTEASQSGVVPTAYAAALPVVATPVGGLVEQVRHRETGVVATAANAESLAAAICLLLDDPQLYAHCSQGALSEARDRLSWQRIADQIAEICVHVGARTRGREEMA